MNYYYASAGEQKGPIPEEDLHALVKQGSISSETLIWREGMPTWQPYAQVISPALSSPSVTATVCGICGKTFAPAELIWLGGQLCCAGCKPVAVQRMKEGVHSNSHAESIRKEHIKHEASTRSVGTLYYLGAGALFFISVAGLFFPSDAGFGQGGIVATIFLLFLAVCQAVVGTGVRGLKKWARIPSGILSGFGLIGFPIGTIINAYILYLLFSRKGRMVFSDEYKNVIEQTPHIKYRTSIVIWILLGLVVFGLALAILLPLFVRHNR
jgi:hypothetical protein